ncbi:hypothetical protein FB45DRAFT_28486 [Roridomyces roridus]|uniref:Uncharacterized protein n=1 Tax=Roridomyces roridus TaxID=1738132 RepID=A0AAD7CKL7_9AGAR|nr:hypothetical protein FB45DRAFT_28486 [Roridomyces roridus]
MHPHLPVELLTDIIALAWNMPLSPQERTLMQTSRLVNSTWAETFDLVSSRDVYITSPASSGRFLGHLISRPMDGLAVRSLTVQIGGSPSHKKDNDTSNTKRTVLIMEAALIDLLDRLDVFDATPNLHHLSVHYLDALCESDLFRRHGLASLPPSITHLELRCSFSGDDSGAAAKFPQRAQRSIRWYAPSIANLAVIGVGDAMTRDMLEACPNTRVLEVDSSCRFEMLNVSILRC